MKYEKLNQLVAKTLGWKAPLIESSPNRPPCPVKHFDYFNPSPEVEAWRSNYHWRNQNGGCWNDPPDYTKNMLNAFDALNQFKHWELSSPNDDNHKANSEKGLYHCDIWTEKGLTCVNGSTAQLAICFALLNANGVTRKEVEEALREDEVIIKETLTNSDKFKG